MKKLINIIIICSVFNTIAFSQKVDENNSEPEQSIIDFLDSNQELIKSNNALYKNDKLKRVEVEKQEVSAEKKYKLSRTRILRDPINRSLYNEKIRGSNGYRYNNRF